MEMCRSVPGSCSAAAAAWLAASYHQQKVMNKRSHLDAAKK